MEDGVPFVKDMPAVGIELLASASPLLTPGPNYLAPAWYYGGKNRGRWPPAHGMEASTTTKRRQALVTAQVINN
jgi:hypothetical protein